MWESPAPWGSTIIYGLLVLDSVREQTEQATKSTPISSIPPWSLCHLLPPGSCPVYVISLTSFEDGLWCGSLSQINSFLPNSMLVTVFHHHNSNPDEDILSLWIGDFTGAPISEKKANETVVDLGQCYSAVWFQTLVCMGWGEGSVGRVLACLACTEPWMVA